MLAPPRPAARPDPNMSTPPRGASSCPLADITELEKAFPAFLRTSCFSNFCASRGGPCGLRAALFLFPVRGAVVLVDCLPRFPPTCAWRSGPCGLPAAFFLSPVRGAVVLVDCLPRFPATCAWRSGPCGLPAALFCSRATALSSLFSFRSFPLSRPPPLPLPSPAPRALWMSRRSGMIAPSALSTSTRRCGILSVGGCQTGGGIRGPGTCYAGRAANITARGGKAAR